jgi:RNA polymerase sigma-70 factor (ECF subfamily)
MQDWFATTRWTVVLAAGGRPAPEADAAMAELCQAYWYPLYAYTRRRGCSREDAEDLIQGFFARLLERNCLDGLASDKGRFRAFLLAALKHHLANEWDRARRLKRGGGAVHFSLDWQDADTRYSHDVVDPLSPDRVYDRAWAVTLLEQVLGRLQEECTTEGKAMLFETLKPFLTVGKKAIPYAEAAGALGLAEPAARVAVHRLRRRYRELLREEISHTLTDPGQVDDEMRALLGAFAE